MLGALPILLAIPAWPQIGAVVAPPQDPQGHARQLNIDTFEKVWTTIRDKHWQKDPGGLDWQAVHAEFYPRIVDAKSDDEAVAMAKVPMQFFILFVGAMVFVFYLFAQPPMLFEKTAMKAIQSEAGFSQVQGRYDTAWHSREKAAEALKRK